MKEAIVFHLEHLDRYAIIDKPCTIIVKNNSRVSLKDIYTGDGKPRWILSLKAITEPNLELIKGLCKSDTPLTYEDIGHLLMTGCIWEEQAMLESDLPCKGEEMIAVFDYVKNILRCTSITLIPRKQPKLYMYASELFNEINEFENIIKSMGND
jgi:hypothetical protein